MIIREYDLSNIIKQEFLQAETVSVLLYVFTNSFVPIRCDTRSIFKRSLIGLNSEFFFPLDQFPYQSQKAQSALLFTHNWKETIPFLRVFALCEIQPALIRI